MLPDLTGRQRWFVLDGHAPRAAANVTEWAQWFSHHGREAVVAKTTVGEITVITKFTGIDRGLQPSDLPALFETVAMHGSAERLCGMSRTWAEALARHHREVLAHDPPPPLQPPTPSPRRVRPMHLWTALRRAVTRHAALFSFRHTKE